MSDNEHGHESYNRLREKLTPGQLERLLAALDTIESAGWGEIHIVYAEGKITFIRTMKTDKVKEV